MNDREIIDNYKAKQKEATELNLAIHEAKRVKDEQIRKGLARELASLQAWLAEARDDYKAAVQRGIELVKDKQTLILTIHHPKKGYRRLATPPNTPAWDAVLALAEDAPEWGVISYVSVPDSEDIPEDWYDLPE